MFSILKEEKKNKENQQDSVDCHAPSYGIGIVQCIFFLQDYSYEQYTVSAFLFWELNHNFSEIQQFV